MKKDKSEKISFICFFFFSICYYSSGIIGIFIKDESNWLVNLCLESAFLCLSTTHLNKDITMIVCHTTKNDKNILIGDYSMEYTEGDCKN